jgi:hypothetical protein
MRSRANYRNHCTGKLEACADTRYLRAARREPRGSFDRTDIDLGGLAGEGDVSRSAFERDPDELAVTPAQATPADGAEAIEEQFKAQR